MENRLRLAQGQVRAVLANCSLVLLKHLGDPDSANAGRVMQAMMKMVKIDISAIRAAYDDK